MIIRKSHLDKSFPENNADSASEKLKAESKDSLGLRVERIFHSGQKQDPSETMSDEMLSNNDSFFGYSEMRLADLVHKAQQVLPLPREKQLSVSLKHRNWLMAQLNQANSEEDLDSLAYSLNHKQISLLFPILASMKRRSYRERIKKVITLRASNVLYAEGWTTLQFIYPNNQVASVLTSLSDQLKILNKNNSTAIDKDTKSVDTDLFPYPHLNWSKIKLITDISNPSSRRFINNITKHLLQNNIEIDVFFQDYGIYDDLSFGKALESNYQTEKLEKSFAEIRNTSMSWRDLLGFDRSD